MTENELDRLVTSLEENEFTAANAIRELRKRLAAAESRAAGPSLEELRSIGARWLRSITAYCTPAEIADTLVSHRTTDLEGVRVSYDLHFAPLCGSGVPASAATDAFHQHFLRLVSAVEKLQTGHDLKALERWFKDCWPAVYKTMTDAEIADLADEWVYHVTAIQQSAAGPHTGEFVLSSPQLSRVDGGPADAAQPASAATCDLTDARALLAALDAAGWTVTRKEGE